MKSLIFILYFKFHIIIIIIIIFVYDFYKIKESFGNVSKCLRRGIIMMKIDNVDLVDKSDE